MTLNIMQMWKYDETAMSSCQSPGSKWRKVVSRGRATPELVC